MRFFVVNVETNSIVEGCDEQHEADMRAQKLGRTAHLVMSADYIARLPVEARPVAPTESWELWLDGQPIARSNYATERAFALDRAEEHARKHQRQVILHWGSEHIEVEAPRS